MKLFDGVRTMFFAIADAIVPLRVRSARTKERTVEDIPLSPTVHELLGAHVTTIMDYRNPVVQDLIRALKYDGSAYAAQLAAAVLADYLHEEIAAARTFSPRRILLIPIPLHKNRARMRGFNQIELVLRALPPEFKDGTLSTLAPHAFVRTRETPPQTHLAREGRIKNVRDAFTVADESLTRGGRIFLIDDVTTTGATLIEAGKALKKIAAEVTLLALARA